MSHIPGITVRPDRVTDPVYVVTVVFNPFRFERRWALYHKFAHHVSQAGAILYTAEIAFGEREFAVTDSANSRHLQLRTPELLWHKERALNLLTQRLPSDWKYLAWIDADVAFARTDWANELRHVLQINPIAQLFRHAEDLDFDHAPIQRHLSFAASHRDQVTTPRAATGKYHGAVTVTAPDGGRVQAWHPGFAWGIRRDAFDQMGGLLDIGIVGAGDNHMAKSLIGHGGHSCHPQVSTGYRQAVLGWQENAAPLHGNIGVVEGLLLHHWHGPKINRKYWDRWKILTETQFDPKDLRVDASGLYRLKPAAADLRRRLVDYFRQRNEDAPY